MKLFRRQNITGSDNSTYMVRWILIGCRFFSIRVHKFVRDDHDVPHDHPWDFFTIILKGGYWEDIPGEWTCWDKRLFPDGPKGGFTGWMTSKWYAPGSFRFVKAETKHKVRLGKSVCEKCANWKTNPVAHTQDDCSNPIPCWTLVFTGPNRRKWGFWCPRGWVEWREFLFNRKGTCNDQ